MVMNYFDVLGLSVQEIEGRDEATIAKTVDAAHKKLYARTVGSYANVPRKDGRTQAQWQVILNEARDTLKDPQKRREHIAELPESKKAAKQAARKAVKRAADRRAAKRAAPKKATAGKWAEVKQSVVRPAVEFVVKHAEIISATGLILVVLGAALTLFATPVGRDIFWLGTTVLWVGLPAFLYKGSRRRILVFGAAGIILRLLGYVLSSEMIAVLGGLVVMCGLLVFLFKQSWIFKIVEVARHAAAWWMAKTAAWSRVSRMGATGVVLGLTLLVISVPLRILSGGAADIVVATFDPIIFLLIWGGVSLIVARFLWWMLSGGPSDR